MIKLSVRDKDTREWVKQQLQDATEYGGYEYYKDMNKEKHLVEYARQIKSIIKSSISNFKKKVSIYTDIEVKAAKNLGAIARYVAETSANVPIILLDIDVTLKSIQEMAEERAIDNSPQGISGFVFEELSPSFSISIYHEMGHAIIDELRTFGYELGYGRKNHSKYKNEEDMVEQFGRDIYDNEEIDQEMKNVISDILKLRKGEELE